LKDHTSLLLFVEAEKLGRKVPLFPLLTLLFLIRFDGLADRGLYADTVALLWRVVPVLEGETSAIDASNLQVGRSYAIEQTVVHLLHDPVPRWRDEGAESPE
jgi:hypothetical protein